MRQTNSRASIDGLKAPTKLQWLVNPITALALLGSFALMGADAATEQRLKNIELQLDALQKENTSLKARLQAEGLGGTGPAIVKGAGKENKIQLGGMLQAQYEAGNTPDTRFSNADRFLVRRARLYAAGSFLESFSWKLEGEFGNANLKNNASYKALATDTYIAWTRYDFANVKLGQFKTTFGHEQLVSDSVLPFAERSLVSDRFTIGRQVGVAVVGDFYNKRLGYMVGAFNGPASNNGFNDNEKFTYTARLTGVPWKGKVGKWDSQWSVAVDGYASRDSLAGAISLPDFKFDSVPGGAIDDIFVGDRRVWAVDSQFKLGPLDFMGEYFHGFFKPANALPFKRINAEGFQVTAAAFVIPKKLQPAIRYETLDPNVDLRGNSSDEWVFGLNYFIKDHDLKLQLDYHLGNSTGAKDNQGRLIARAQLLF
ncbi:MAG: hypothetical protein HY299_04855 [Verrucomicrobia bacterium]|nr:hypothetical protein [Verrucomicrobiota bacterium]